MFICFIQWIFLMDPKLTSQVEPRDKNIRLRPLTLKKIMFFYRRQGLRRFFFLTNIGIRVILGMNQLYI